MSDYWIVPAFGKTSRFIERQLTAFFVLET
jgi:hypothetical protein